MEQRTIKFKEIEWLNILSPNKEITEQLREKYNFHELDLEDCLTENQRPKIDEYEKYLFIVLQFPIFNPRKKYIEVAELDIFIGQDYFITLHEGNLKAFNDIFDQVTEKIQTRKKFMGKGTGYVLYEVVSGLFDSCFSMLEKMEEEINGLEKDLFEEESRQRDILQDVMRLKRNIINFHRVIVSQRTVVAQLEHKNKKFLPENLEVYFDDVVDKIEKIYNNLENLRALVESLHSTNESIISHNTTKVMKILTIFSVIMLPLNLVAGIYGMNLTILPYAEHPWAFYMFLFAMICIAFGMVGFFRWKKWL